MFFQTAPPQPASKARMTCSPQFVGGAEASQNGFMHRIPAKVVSSVGILFLQPCCDADASTFAISDCIDYLATSVCTVASGEVFWIRSLPSRPIDHNASLLQLDLAAV